MFKKKLISVRNKAQIRLISKNTMPLEPLAELPACYLGTPTLTKLWNFAKKIKSGDMAAKVPVR